MKFLLSLFLFALLTTATGFAADGPVRHIVILKFKKDADPATVKKIEADFVALKTKIPLIQNLEWGTNVSAEDRAKGFTHCWIVTFKNTEDRDAYSVNPNHKAFAAELKDVIDDVFVFDFVPQG
jgi:Stress responsive A/B Barrel Domain